MTSTVVLAKRTSRWVPWDGQPRRADLLCWYAIAGMAVFYSAMWPVRPLLIGSNPVLLELLTGSKESIIAAGAFAGVGSLPLGVVIVAAVPSPHTASGCRSASWSSWWWGSGPAGRSSATRRRGDGTGDVRRGR